jgi:hypothetical protein
MEMTGRLLIVGESNPYGANPEWALYCHPPGCAGYRLRHILGLPEPEYLSIHRTNLCEGDWNKDAAKLRARELLSPEAPWRVIVLLGRKVTETFEKVALSGITLEAFSTKPCSPMTLVSLPHPSGRNAGAWNPNLHDRARQILRGLVPELPWGQRDRDDDAAEASA